MKKFFDKNGVQIMVSDIIHNERLNITRKVDNIQGELWFGDVNTTLNDNGNNWKRMTDRFEFATQWEIVDIF